MRKSVFFFPNKFERDAKQLSKLSEIYASGVRGVRRDMTLIRSVGVNSDYGTSMTWLMHLIQRRGQLVTENIDGDLLEQERALLTHFNGEAFFNGIGLASKELVSDPTCYPLRGALLRFINDGKDFPKIIAAMSIAADVSLDNEIVFLVPRNDEILVVGGIAQREEWKLDLTLDSPVIQRMRARCEAFHPYLKNSRLNPEYPLAQGLRPGREANIRVEREPRNHGTDPSRIIHSYGHGGSGWSLSFGCAEKVAGMIEDVLCDDTSKSGII